MIRGMTTAIALVSFLLAPPVERVPLAGSSVFAGLEQDWRNQMSDFGVTGFSIVAIKDRKVVVLDAIGDADPLSGRRADIDTRYYIASVTKTMTATAIAQLVDQGKLSLTDKVQKYLPKFDLSDREYAKEVTIADLLSHNAGIQAQLAIHEAYTGQITEERFYALLAKCKPSKRVAYSNDHYTILGRIIQVVSGQKWQDYLQQNVFLPLGMSRTTARISDTHDDPNLAIPLEWNGGVLQPAGGFKTDRTMHAAGGVMTSARDMARYMLMFLGVTEPGAKAVIRTEMIKSAFGYLSRYPMTGSIRKMDGFGYGWRLGDYRDTKGHANHGGSYRGYACWVGLVPEKGIGVAVMTNNLMPGFGFATQVQVEALDRLLDYPLDTRWREGNMGQAKTVFDQIKALKPIGPNPVIAGGLSLKPESYVGRFHNDLGGEIAIRLVGGYLTFDWGDLHQELKSTGMDSFSSHNDAHDAGTPGKFIVLRDAVSGLELTFDGEKYVFERK